MKGWNSFEKLAVWQASRELRNRCFLVVKKFPKEEKYRLCDQIIRASRSVPANIAEGHGRYHFGENIQFCRQARGSLIELKEHFICAFDCGYISENQLKNFKDDIAKTGKLLNGYINYLSRMRNSNKSTNTQIIK